MMTEFQPSPTQDEAMEAWRKAGDILIGGQYRIERRLGVLEDDVAVLKTDMAEVKTDVVDLKGQLSRHELATERGFQRMDAQFERLIGYIQRDETRR